LILIALAVSYCERDSYGGELSHKGKPNIVFILADDMGYADASCFGGKTPTPNVDRLAEQGAKLTNFYSNGPECTPTRAAFMTGRYQHRVGGLECALGTGNVGRYDDAIRLAAIHEMGLPVAETSIARMLKDAGYATICIGKWHLGYEPKFFPGPHGFDYWFGIIGGSGDYFYHTEPEGFAALYLNGKPIERDGYTTDLLTAEAVKYIDGAGSGPFFLYVPYTAPHEPIQGPDDRPAKQPPPGKTIKGDAKSYAAMIRRLDDGVGEIVAALEKKGLSQNTVLVFNSDNGGTKMADNHPLSGHKGQTFEGGIRVPCIVRWPGEIKPGIVSEQAAITMDLTASFARIGGAKSSRLFDGIDIIKKLQDGAPVESRSLFWRGRRGDNTWRGVREGTMKFVSEQTGKKIEEHVFDLASDISEKHDLAVGKPEELNRLKGLLAAWEQEVKPVR
jgi:N-acetylgalactosamine-6-sulfatase